MRHVPIGATGSTVLLIDRPHLASEIGAAPVILPPVLGTPALIAVMGRAALDAIAPSLEPGETALATRIDVRHLSPAPAGARIVAEARVTHVDGRRIELQVAAMDDSGQIAVATHELVVVAAARIERHLAAKRAARAHLRNMVGGA